jgi:hypothetical protein
MDATRARPDPVPEPLARSLSALGRRTGSLARWRGTARALTLLAAGAGLLGWTDFLIELPGGLRFAAGALLALAAAAAWAAVVRDSRRRSDPARLAAALDRHAGTGGEILAGTELALGADALGDPVTRALAVAAAEEAGRKSAEVDPRAVLPSTSLRKPWLAAAGVAGILALVALLWPGVFSAQALRLIDPLGDHPPYSPYRFAVEPGDASVRYSDPFTIQVAASGERLPAKVDWIVEREDGTKSVHPLIDQGEGKYTGTIGVVETPFRYHVRGPEGRSRGFRVAVVLTPRFERVEARLEWPRYTRKRTVEGAYPEAGLIGVKGTRVTLTAISNRPLSGGKIVWTDSKDPEVPLAVRPGPEGKNDRVEGSFSIGRDARFELTIVDREGNACREPFQGRVVLLADRPPTVTIVEPPVESYATPKATVPVVMEAEDDYGLSRAALFRSLNGTRDHPLELPLPADPTFPLRLETPLALKTWDLEPGDVIEFYALVADNDPDGPKAAQSKVHRLQIISEEDFRKIQMSQEGIDELVEKYRPIEDALERARQEAAKLDEALKKLDRAEGAEAEKARREAEAARAALQNALEEAARLAREQAERAPVFDVEKEFKKELDKLAKELEDLRKQGADAMKDLEGSLAPGAPAKPGPQSPGRKGLAELRKKLGDSSEEFGQGLKMPLDVLEKVYRLLEYESRFTALALAQEDLARRTRRFEGREKVEAPEEREDLRALADEQRGLREELDDVLQGIRDAAAKLPPGEPFDELRRQAEEFATAVVEAKAPEVLSKALKALDGREGKSSAEGTRLAADLLMSFVKKCDGMGRAGQSACLKFQPNLSSSMQSTLNQLLGGKGLPRPVQSGQASGSGLEGSGGSSTARRSGGKVGVYGDRPVASRSGGGKGRKGEGGAGTRSVPGGAGGEGSAAAARTDLLYGGVPMEAVPGEYRAAVREFFRRVVEESGREGK